MLFWYKLAKEGKLLHLLIYDGTESVEYVFLVLINTELNLVGSSNLFAHIRCTLKDIFKPMNVEGERA